MKATTRARVWFRIYQGATMALGTLPFSVASRLGETFGALAYKFAAGPRATVGANLRHIVGPDMDAASFNALVLSSFRSYGRYWTELACVSARGDKFNKLKISLENWHYIDDAMAAGKGVLVALPHLGSWDVAGGLICREGIPLTTVAEDATSADLFNWFVEKRSNLGLTVLPFERDTANQLIGVLRSGGVVALVADRDVIGDGIEVEFFGAKTRAPGGPAVLALRTHTDIVPVVVIGNGRGKYRVVANPPIKAEREGRFRQDVQRLTQEVLSEFETYIRREPQNWHVFQPHWPQDATSSTIASDATGE